jgi:hypothetical protein
MKFIDQTVLCKGFAICKGHITSNETYNYGLDETTKDTKFSQILYILDGVGGAAFDHEGNKITDMEFGKAYDFKEYYGKEYLIKSYDTGGTWIAINPVPASKVFIHELLNKNTNKTIVGTKEENIIICLEGSITINDKVLNQLQYARVLDGKTAEISINEKSIAMHLNAKNNQSSL